MNLRLITGLIGALALLGSLTWLIGSRNSWRDTAQANERLYRDEQTAHRLTVANYRAAAEAVRKADAEHKAKVEAEQRAINERTSREYEARIADARAYAGRLQQQAGIAGSNSSRAGTAPVSVVSRGPEGSPGAAEKAGFSIADRLTATEQAIQLDQLIRWVNDQTKVNR